MPRNKEALIRYRVINRCLLDYEFVPKNQLIEACSKALDHYPIGERTIDGDIHAMRYDNGLGYYAPIEYSKSRRAYYYSDPAYSIDNIPLNREEIEALSFSATLLEQFKHIDIFSRFSGAVQKIVDAINIRRIRKDDSIYNFIDFEKAPYYHGSDHIAPIMDAIRNSIALKIIYHPFFSGQPYKMTLHPYLLKEYRNRWYAVGWNDHYREIRTYALDRIKEISESKASFIRSEFDPENYFAHTVGITSPGGDPPEIVVAIKKQQAQYLITQPIHASQEIIKENEDEITFRFRVHPTYEFRSIILGYGKDAKVLKPESLREEVVESLKAMLEGYGEKS